MGGGSPGLLSECLPFPRPAEGDPSGLFPGVRPAGESRRVSPLPAMSLHGETGANHGSATWGMFLNLSGPRFLHL